MTSLLFALTLLATTPEVAKARADVATAREVQAACWTPAECSIARELVAASEDELSTARALSGPDTYATPFESMDVPPFAGTPFPDADDVAQMIAEGEALAAR